MMVLRRQRAADEPQGRSHVVLAGRGVEERAVGVVDEALQQSAGRAAAGSAGCGCQGCKCRQLLRQAQHPAPGEALWGSAAAWNSLSAHLLGHDVEGRLAAELQRVSTPRYFRKTSRIGRHGDGVGAGEERGSVCRCRAAVCGAAGPCQGRGALEDAGAHYGSGEGREQRPQEGGGDQERGDAVGCQLQHGCAWLSAASASSARMLVARLALAIACML